MRHSARFTLVAIAALSVSWSAGFGAAQDKPLRETYRGDDFALREAMVPMRDGVELYTLILTPKGAKGPLPILLERTPYDASRVVGGTAALQLEVLRGSRHAGGGYIVVIQDLRGRFRSGGEYAMYRVPRGAFNQSQTDETTDAWDTIDWLVKNVTPNSGKVGVWGTSYPGWLTLAALREPHPALAAAVPFNPVVDVWKADDWFHWGAFRFGYAFDFIYSMQTRKGASVGYPYEARDMYAWLLAQGPAASLGSRLDERHEMWPRLVQNPAYGPYWKDVAADRWFDAPKRVVPTLHVHGFWDQEDIYGAPASYSALEKHDRGNDHNFFAAGPWYHGQHFADGTRLGPIAFDEDTAKRFREDVLEPFLRRFLKGESVDAPAPATVFETGPNRWRRFESWPPPSAERKLYLRAGGRLAFDAPGAGEGASEYVADPARPVPNAPRPHWGFDYDNQTAIAAWRRWLVEDQRFVDGRPDVLTFVSEPLTAPLTVRGPVLARLHAETSGSDADWVVKLIDVYPDHHAVFELSGYQLMVSADIFRGRYRESLERPAPLTPGAVLAYEIPLPHASHTFLPGHRLMVQVQSSWFPLYDRNPQTYVASIMSAPPDAYRARRHRIHHSAGSPTHLALPVALPVAAPAR